MSTEDRDADHGKTSSKKTKSEEKEFDEQGLPVETSTSSDVSPKQPETKGAEEYLGSKDPSPSPFSADILDVLSGHHEDKI